MKKGILFLLGVALVWNPSLTTGANPLFSLGGKEQYFFALRLFIWVRRLWLVGQRVF